MTITVTKQEFATRLDELYALALGGSEVVIEDGSTASLRLTARPPTITKRTPGLLAGRIRMSEDFDAPLKLVDDEYLSPSVTPNLSRRTQLRNHYDY